MKVQFIKACNAKHQKQFNLMMFKYFFMTWLIKYDFMLYWEVPRKLWRAGAARSPREQLTWSGDGGALPQ